MTPYQSIGHSKLSNSPEKHDISCTYFSAIFSPFIQVSGFATKISTRIRPSFIFFTFFSTLYLPHQPNTTSIMSKLSRLHELLIVKRTQRDGVDRPVDMLDNDSIRPTPVKDRTWSQLTYMMFWFSATANVSNLYTASTGMSMGLTMWEAIGCSFGGQILAGALMAVNGRAGAMYRIPFPVLCRSSFGHWGALWPTFNRAAMSIVWNGVNSVQGGQCL